VRCSSGIIIPTRKKHISINKQGKIKPIHLSFSSAAWSDIAALNIVSKSLNDPNNEQNVKQLKKFLLPNITTQQQGNKQ
jgi:hypothetical protein